MFLGLLGIVFDWYKNGIKNLVDERIEIGFLDISLEYCGGIKPKCLVKEFDMVSMLELIGMLMVG